MSVCGDNSRTLLLNKLKEFYKNDYNSTTFNKYVSGNQISLRVLDYVCTKYSKDKPILYKNKNEEITNVYTSYKDQLKAYSKRQFDPFKRHERITLEINQKKVETTLAQLNFFKWMIEIRLFDLLEDHYPKILEHMKNTLNKKKV